jgi:small subunit ribosomal protein S2
MSDSLKFSMAQLFEAGAHFGHHKCRCNPKMSSYLYGVKNNIHIINLEKTVPMLRDGLEAIKDVAQRGGRVLFVGTKRQARDPIAEAAKRCGQYYINHRWLGGLLTNWKTVSISINKLKQLAEKLEAADMGLTKKEMLSLRRQHDKLELALGGIREMGGIPDALFIIDTNMEAIAISEAYKLRIPTIAICDSNSNPGKVTYPVPGNDDSSKAIELYCDLVSKAVLIGLQEALASSNVDFGASESAESLGLEANESNTDGDISEPVEITTEEPILENTNNG